MSRRSRLREVLCAVLIIVAALPRGARAQDTGIVTGSVVDGTGQVLPGATVTLVNEATAGGRTVTTNERGEFTFRAVQPGTYTVSRRALGISQIRAAEQRLNASSQLALGALTLEIGSLAEVVTVAAQGTTVETRNSDYSGLLTSKQISQIQTKGRDVVNLLRLLPGRPLRERHRRHGGQLRIADPEHRRPAANLESGDGGRPERQRVVGHQPHELVDQPRRHRRGQGAAEHLQGGVRTQRRREHRDREQERQQRLSWQRLLVRAPRRLERDAMGKRAGRACPSRSRRSTRPGSTSADR